MTAHIALLDRIPHRIVQANPRRTFRETADSDEALFVTIGILALCRLDGRGRQIVALRFAGECVLLDRQSAYSVEAMIPSQVAVVTGFTKLLERRPELTATFWRIAQRDASIAHEWLVNNSRDCGARVAHLLCETAIRGGHGVDEMLVPFTQLQIGDITGQTSVNVNRVLADLERQGLIERDGRRLKFLDWEGLRRMASFQPDYLAAA